MNLLKDQLKYALRRVCSPILHDFNVISTQSALNIKEHATNSVAEIRAAQIASSQTTQVLLFHHYRDLMRRKVSPLPGFSEVGFRCHSQFEEDGILLYSFALI
jgi:hypothetical protein